MMRAANKEWKAFAIFLFAFLAAAGTPANPGSAHRVGRPVNLCYCSCKAAKQNRECIRLCDLRESEGRSWGAACRKRPEPLPHKDPESQPRPTKQNGPETARR
jgi:hypothetical protein